MRTVLTLTFILLGLHFVFGTGGSPIRLYPFQRHGIPPQAHGNPARNKFTTRDPTVKIMTPRFVMDGIQAFRTGNSATVTTLLLM